MNGPTDRLNDAVLTNCWLQAGSSHEPEKGLAFVFLGRVCRDQRSTARRKGRTKIPCFFPHCVQSAERDVEYQNDPKVEEVLSHQHSILVLHDPLQVDCPSLI